MKLSDILPIPQILPLRHPVTKEPLGLTLKVIGHDSKAFRDAYRAIIKTQQSKKNAEPDLLEVEQNNLRLVAVCIIGWDAEADEAFGPYTPQRALEIVSMDELSFVKEQVEAFVAERANFFRRDTEAVV